MHVHMCTCVDRCRYRCVSGGYCGNWLMQYRIENLTTCNLWFGEMGIEISSSIHSVWETPRIWRCSHYTPSVYHSVFSSEYWVPPLKKIYCHWDPQRIRVYFCLKQVLQIQLVKWNHTGTIWTFDPTCLSFFTSREDTQEEGDLVKLRAVIGVKML